MSEKENGKKGRKLALLSNVNMNLVIRLLQREAEVYEAEGYGNGLGMWSFWSTIWNERVPKKR